MKKPIFFALFLTLSVLTAYSRPLKIARQGVFATQGTTLQRPGTYDPTLFSGWETKNEAGESVSYGYAVVEYQVPAKAQPYSVVLVHGEYQSGSVWLTSPDNSESFATLLLRKGYPTYTLDLPGCGRAAQTKGTTRLRLSAADKFHYQMARLGDYPAAYPNSQYPQDNAALEQFYRLFTPLKIDTTAQKAALQSVTAQVEHPVVITHGAGALAAWEAAEDSTQIELIIAMEPTRFVFPEGEEGSRVRGLTGTAHQQTISQRAFNQLCKTPIFIYFGDYIPDGRATTIGQDFARLNWIAAREFAQAVERHGGRCTIVRLPQIGMQGNSFMLMQDSNKAQIADLIHKDIKALSKKKK